MAFLRCFCGGAVGGLIGLAIWAAVAHFTGFEVGYIAWGVGFLTGFGVRAMAKDRTSPALGALAVLIAVASIVGAKYLVVCLLVSGIGAGLEGESDSSDAMIANLATEVAAEFEKAGRKVDWPPPEELDDDLETEGELEKSEVWQEASRRWNALPAEERQAKIEEHNQIVSREMDKLAAELQSMLRAAAFRASFSGFDLLWFGLAALTAFRLGSGGMESS